MDPNGNGFGTGISSGPVAGDIVVHSSSSPRRFKWKIFIPIAVAILIVLALVVLFVFKPTQGGSVSEVYSKLWDFYYDASYQDLIENYTAGVEKASSLRDNKMPLIFAFTDSWIDTTKQSIGTIEVSYEELKAFNISVLSGDEKKKFNTILEKTRKSLDVISSNIEVISKFHDAFIVPLSVLDEGGTPASCSESNEMSILINDSNTSDAAKKYYSVYCKVIDGYSKADNWEAFLNSISAPIYEAADSLNLLLESVDSSDDSIKELLSELDR